MTRQISALSHTCEADKMYEKYDIMLKIQAQWFSHQILQPKWTLNIWNYCMYLNGRRLES